MPHWLLSLSVPGWLSSSPQGSSGCPRPQSFSSSRFIFIPQLILSSLVGFRYHLYAKDPQVCIFSPNFSPTTHKSKCHVNSPVGCLTGISVEQVWKWAPEAMAPGARGAPHAHALVLNTISRYKEPWLLAQLADYRDVAESAGWSWRI